MAASKPQISKEGEVWVLKLTQQDGKEQIYRCATERQARQMALVLTSQGQPAQPV